MTPEASSDMTPEEYLDRERSAPERSNYIQGEIVARSGLTLRHSRIATNTLAALFNAKSDACAIFNSLLRVCINWNSLICYPDVTVICDDAQYVDDKRDTITNPRLIVEVLSPTTRAYDRGEKARLFRMVPSLQEFLLIEQEPVDVEHWRKLPNGNWELATIRESARTLDLDSIHCRLPVDEIYGGTDPYR